MTTFRYSLTSSTKPLTVEDYRYRAQRALPQMVWAYVDGGAENEVSMRRNRQAFQRWALRQHVLAGVTSRTPSVTVCGDELSLPVIVAPTGATGLACWEGERAAAQAAERAGSRLVLSTGSSYSIEEVASGTDAQHWFQLYPIGNDRALMTELMHRARNTGYRVLVVTVDAPTHGLRENERRRGLGIPPTLTPFRIIDGAFHPRWAAGFLRHRRFGAANISAERSAKTAMQSMARHIESISEDMTWHDLEWIREQWDGPLLVKGILEPDDARRAIEVGANGVVVSNHGGRQLDGVVGTLDALPAIVEAVGDTGEVLLDGGIRRGSDVVKALCLGARAVLIGRPMIYGLVVGGVDGVIDVLEILRSEIDRTMVLMGVSDVTTLNRDHLTRLHDGAPL